MADVTFKLVFNDIGKITAALEPRAEAIINKTARDVQLVAKNSMSGPKTGKTYIRGGRVHVASAKHEAPAIDMGNLFNSVKIKPLKRLTRVIYPEADYGAILELYKSRPWLKPALMGRKKAFIAAMGALFDE